MWSHVNNIIRGWMQSWDVGCGSQILFYPSTLLHLILIPPISSIAKIIPDQTGNRASILSIVGLASWLRFGARSAGWLSKVLIAEDLSSYFPKPVLWYSFSTDSRAEGGIYSLFLHVTEIRLHHMHHKRTSVTASVLLCREPRSGLSFEQTFEWIYNVVVGELVTSPARMRFITSIILSLLSLVSLNHALQYHGADFSSLVNVENSGVVYKDSSSASGAKFETILHNHGVNLARIRVWTSTNNADYSLNYGLALAKRAAAAGMQIFVDLHYSDTCKFSLPLCLPYAWYWTETRLCRGRSWKAGHSQFMANRSGQLEHSDLHVCLCFFDALETARYQFSIKIYYEPCQIICSTGNADCLYPGKLVPAFIMISVI